MPTYQNLNEDKGKNRFQINNAYNDQHGYDSSEPNDNKDEGVIGLIKILDDNDEIMSLLFWNLIMILKLIT